MPFSYSYLILIVLPLIKIPFGSMAGKVSITQNITGLIGKHDTKMTCSFISEAGEQISIVQIYGKNKTQEFDDINIPIAIFIPDQPGKLHSSVNYLKGRVTFTNITTMSTNATLTFNELKCEDEKDYMCKCYYEDSDGSPSSYEKSASTRVSVKVTSSKPDHISSIIVTSTTGMQGLTSSIYNTTLSTQKDEMLSVSTSSIETVTNTHLQSTDKIPYVFREEDTVIFTCSGSIGNPPGKLIWQKTFPKDKKPVIYSNETTYIEELPGKCSFKGTSHLTVDIYPEDLKGKMRCYEESQLHVPGMYIETEPFDVHFKVNHVVISKQPNQKQYGQKTDKITLTCEGKGNPEPHYEWFKEGNNNSILSKRSYYVIDNVIQNKRGVYICEVYNIINDVIYRKSNSVEIDILHVDELPSSQDSSLLRICIVYVIPVICVVLFTGICVAVIKRCCIRPKKKENEENYYQTLSHDGIIVNAEYASVTHTHNTFVGEAVDNLVCSNGKDGDKNQSRNKDELQTGYLTCIQVTGSTSVNGLNNYEDLIASDRTIVYDEINQQTILNDEVSKAQMSVSTDNGDHYDAICMDVAIQSSVNDG